VERFPERQVPAEYFVEHFPEVQQPAEHSVGRFHEAQELFQRGKAVSVSKYARVVRPPRCLSLGSEVAPRDVAVERPSQFAQCN